MKQAIKFLFLSGSILLFSFGSGSKEETAAAGSAYIEDYNAGVDAQKSKDYETAVRYYQKAVDQKSDFSDAWNNMAFCYRMIAKSYLTKAGDAYEKALQYTPKHEKALEYQGEYYVTMGLLRKAYENYQMLKQMNSEEAHHIKEKLDPVLKQAQEVLKNYSP
jgi:tetratricopeptide (TPR) repeat protein